MSIVRAQESRDRLAKVQKRLNAKKVKNPSNEAIGGMLALLPKSKGIDAHHRSVMEMPHYDAPSLREALLQRRAFENRDEVLRSFSGILRKLNETFYAQSWDAFHCEPQKAKEEMDTRREGYFQDLHLSKYEERAEVILAQTARLRSNSSLTAAQVRLLRAISAIYNNQPLIVTCRYGKDFRTPALLDELGGFEWNTRATEPVHSVLSAVGKIEPQVLRQLLSPPTLYWTHGDLHFHNILIDLGDLDDPLFKLIDANIDKSGRDIAADLSKLLQSCDALGDFLHEGLFEIRAFLPPRGDSPRLWKIDLMVGSGTITNVLSGGASGAEVFRYLKTDEQLQDYRHIATSFAKLTNEHITVLNNDAKWQTRAVFGLAINLLTSPAFFIQRNPEMALAFAVSGAMVLTEWCHRKDVSVELAKAGYNLTTTKNNGYS